MRQYYSSILGISPEATDAEIKTAFRSMVKRFHPDVNPEPRARERFLELKKAYDYLLNPANKGKPRLHPAQEREEEEKKKREQRMKRAREMRKKKEEDERLAWEKFKNSPAMWAIIFIVLVFYFAIVGVSITTISQYPYDPQKVKEPEFALGVCILIILGFTALLYRFYLFLRK